MSSCRVWWLWAATVIIAFATLAGPALAQDQLWLPRYDEANSGVSAAPVRLPLSLRWKHTTPDPQPTVVAMPAVGPDLVYAPVGASIYAISRRTGELVWSQDVGDVIYSSPVLRGDTLYFGARDNNLWAIDATNGEVKWRFATGGAVDCSPVIVGDVIYFGSDDNRLTALDLNTQQQLWQFETRGDIKATPLVYRDVIVVGSQDRHIYCLNYQGRPIWSKPTSARAFFAAPTGERTKIIYACGREVIAREVYSGRRLWRFKTAGAVVGAPCVLDRKVYVGTYAGDVYCLDANTGRALWKYPQEGATEPISSSPTIAGDVILFRAGARQIHAIALADGSLRWSYALPEPPEKKTAGPTEPGVPGAPGVPGDIFAPTEPVQEAGGVETGPEDEEGTRTEVVEREYKMEDYVDPAVAVAGDSIYVIGDDNVVYGFAAQAPDRVPPLISDAILEVPGKGRTRVTFTPNTTTEDDFEGRYADEIVIPGTPPIFLSALVTDEGSGVNPDSVKVSVNGEATQDFTWDPKENILWYIFDPRGAAANLSNGIKTILLEASDWRGNRATLRVAFTVDNKAKPPEPPQPVAPTVGPGGPGADVLPPGEMAPMP